MDLLQILDLCSLYNIEVTFRYERENSVLIIILRRENSNQQWVGQIPSITIKNSVDPMVVGESSIREALRLFGIEEEGDTDELQRL